MTKQALYDAVEAQLDALFSGENDVICKMANMSALLHATLHFWWVGFYRVCDGETLVLGPFHGPVACMRIAKGKGVCGTAWREGKTIIVPDVHAFDGHIACSAASNSEIVVPIWKNGEVVAVLDIDSENFDAFNEQDKERLEKMCEKYFN